MRQWIGSALVQIMACRLFGAKPLSKPMLGYCQLDPKEQTWMKFDTKFFIHENASENIVCEMAAILSMGDVLTTLHYLIWEFCCSLDTDSLKYDEVEPKLRISLYALSQIYNLNFNLKSNAAGHRRSMNSISLQFKKKIHLAAVRYKYPSLGAGLDGPRLVFHIEKWIKALKIHSPRHRYHQAIWLII